MDLQAALMSDPILVAELLAMLALGTYIVKNALSSCSLSLSANEEAQQRKTSSIRHRGVRAKAPALSLVAARSSQQQTKQGKLGYKDLKSVGSTQFSQKRSRNSELRPALLGNGVGRMIPLSERSLRPQAA